MYWLVWFRIVDYLFCLCVIVVNGVTNLSWLLGYVDYASGTAVRIACVVVNLVLDLGFDTCDSYGLCLVDLLESVCLSVVVVLVCMLGFGCFAGC